MQDARLYQILFLSSFLMLGIGTRDWTLRPEMVLIAIATCLITQALAVWLVEQRHEAQGKRHEASESVNRQARDTRDTNPEPRTSTFSSHFILHPSSFIPPSLLSALITALGLSLLLRTDHYWTMVVAAIAAILSKFVLHVNGKHIFNPANIGIVVAVTLTHDAWISPGQWGEESWYALLFLGAGGVVLQRVGRWDTTVAFLGLYALLEAGRNFWLGWTWDVWLHRLTSGSLLLFALFMVTDPRTIPNDRTARILWAGAIAIVAFILRNYFFIPTAVFWALFALSPLTMLLDALWQADRFVWRKVEEVKG